MWSKRHLAPPVLGLLLAPYLARGDPSALWLQPSTKWYGADGNWSALSLNVGQPAQQVDVTVSTNLAEIWVVENGGCGTSAICATSRGNLYNISESNSWSSIGPYELDLTYLDLDGNGDYGMDSITVYNSNTRTTTALMKQLVAGINTTDYLTGYFGVGIVPGRFGNVTVQSPISALVEQGGIIPSHSYGYTAGAYYRGSPLSLTLGGYDANRLVAHNTTFTLNSTYGQTQVLLRSIFPAQSENTTFLGFNESLNVLIDSSTPYLWLPTAVCDRIASAYNLTYNTTFGLYVFNDNEAYNNMMSNPNASITFSMSSYDNLNNYGQPLVVPGVINITISANAFAQTLQYPFMLPAIPYGTPAIPYFPLRRLGTGDKAILGRSFLQEAYMITNYELNTFSVHQAVFPNNPTTNISIQTIASSPSSAYPGPAQPTQPGQQGLTREQLIGVIVGSCCIGIGAAITAICLCRRKKRRVDTQHTEDELKEHDYVVEQEVPRTPVGRILSKLSKKFSWRRRGKNIHEVSGTSSYPAEVPATERYEMPVPMELVELDATDTASLHGTSDLGTEGSHPNSAYEAARRRMEQQLQGPVPEYSPSLSQHEDSSKSIRDVSPVAHYRPADNLAPPSPEDTPRNGNFAAGIPSPITPHGDGLYQIPDIPSPIGLMSGQTLSGSNSNPSLDYSPPSSGPAAYALSVSRSPSPTSAGASPVSPLPMPPAPAVQRTPIDPSKVVCLGPLPDNVELPFQQTIPRIVGPDGQTYALPSVPAIPYENDAARRPSAADTLGSDYTIEENTMTRQVVGPSHQHGGFLAADQPCERIDGKDLVHVPVPAERRFSWEDH